VLLRSQAEKAGNVLEKAFAKSVKAIEARKGAAEEERAA
jgi:hypothetical protein